MVHSKTLFKQRTSDTKRFCKFSLISKGSKVTHGVYDRETDKFYGLNKHGKPFMKTAYSTPKQFAVSHGCKAVHFAQHIHVHGKTLKQLATEAKTSAQELMQDFIPPPAPQPAAPIPLDDWTSVTALRLQMAQMEVENARGRADMASIRLSRAGMLLDRCKGRMAEAEDELALAKGELADGQCEYDIAQREEDWELDALEMHKDQLAEERARADTERFEREREANHP